MVRRSFIGALLGFLGLGATTQAAEDPPKKTEGITGRELLVMPEFIALAEHLGINLSLPTTALTIIIKCDDRVDYLHTYLLCPKNNVRPEIPKNAKFFDSFQLFRESVFIGFCKKLGLDYYTFNRDTEIIIASLDRPVEVKQLNIAKANQPSMMETTTVHNEQYRTFQPPTLRPVVEPVK